jgi:phage terminase small subunit
MSTYTTASVIAITDTDEFLSPTLFCQKYSFAHSTLSKYIRKGDIALHQFSGAARPKVNVAEALQVMSTLKRPYTNPALRLVRHDDEPVVARPAKSDLFA